jgi:hypothetical protein
MDMRFVTWNVRSLYRAGSLTVVASELAKYNLDVVGSEVPAAYKYIIVWDGNLTRLNDV